MESNGNEKKGKIKPTQVIMIILLLAVLVVGIIIVLLLTRKQEPVEETQPRDVVINSENVNDVKDAMTESPDIDAFYHVTMNVDWRFNSKGESTDAYVSNAEDNHRTVYFDLVLLDSGEIIYSSDLIPVGSYLRGLTLEKTLEPGKYDAQVVYHLLDDNNKETTTTAVNVTLNISK